LIIPLYMLDTNIISDLIRNPAGKIARHIAKIGDQGLVVSITTAAELRYGSSKAGSPRLLKRIEEKLYLGSARFRLMYQLIVNTEVFVQS